MAQLTQHIPAFVETRKPRETAIATCAADLTSIPWINYWIENPKFYRWSQSLYEYGSQSLLIAEVENGDSQWVVAYMSEPLSDLPEWKESAIAKERREAWNRGDWANAR